MKILSCTGADIKTNFQKNFNKNDTKTSKVENKSNENDFFKYQSMVGLLNKALINPSSISFEGKREKIKDEDIPTVIDMYNQGMTQEEIAEKFNCTQENISYILIDAGIKTEPMATPEFREQVIDMYLNQGMTQEEIAEILGCSHTPISYILRDAGIKTEPKITPEVIERIIKMREQGMSQSQIADSIGCHQVAISKVLIAAGMRTGFKKPNKPSMKSLHGDEIIALYKQGKNQQELAEMYNCSTSTIGRIIESAGLRTKPKITPEIREQIVDMYQNQNKTQEELAKKFECTQATISKILIDAGIKTGPKVTDEKRAQIAYWHNQGLSSRKIAEKVNLHRSTVNKVIKELKEAKKLEN